MGIIAGGLTGGVIGAKLGRSANVMNDFNRSTTTSLPYDDFAPDNWHMFDDPCAHDNCVMIIAPPH